jgi:hypothetical protein
MARQKIFSQEKSIKNEDESPLIEVGLITFPTQEQEDQIKQRAIDKFNDKKEQEEYCNSEYNKLISFGCAYRPISSILKLWPQLEQKLIHKPSDLSQHHHSRL